MDGAEDAAYEAAGKLLLEISFDGTDYSGWQYQPHCISVQEVLEKHLTRLFAGLPIHLAGSSRTDAGVHACGSAASFAIPGRPYIPIAQLRYALNRQLPLSIRIRNIIEVPLAFNARFDAKGKAYTYVLNLGEEHPFTGRYSWHLRKHMPDVDKIRQAAQHLVGTHDFSSFVVERSQIDNAVRTIYRIDIQEFGQYICMTFVGNGFLYKMIRCLAGALEAVGSGKIQPDDIKTILEAKQRTLAPETAPAHGLFLMKVFYDEEMLHQYRLKQLPFYQGVINPE